jgi:hypothetical protein
MLTCLALALAGAVTLSEIPTLAAEVEGDARALAVQTEITPGFLAGLEDFSADAARLSESLRTAGVTQDMPSIFHGIAEDARARAEELTTADTAAERQAAFNGLKPLLNDAIQLAPMAAGAAADVAVRQMAAR